MKKTTARYFIILIVSIPFILSLNANTSSNTASYYSPRFHDIWMSLDSVKIFYSHPDIHITKDSFKILNIDNQEDDIPLDLKQTNNERIVLSSPDKSKLRQNPIYRKIAKWIKWTPSFRICSVKFWGKAYVFLIAKSPIM